MHLPILTSADLRRWATQCYDQANSPRVSGDERERLLKMREGLLALAQEVDWLDGKKESPSTTEGQELRTREVHGGSDAR
jgi:hypothetical protein